VPRGHSWQCMLLMTLHWTTWACHGARWFSSSAIRR